MLCWCAHINCYLPSPYLVAGLQMLQNRGAIVVWSSCVLSFDLQAARSGPTSAVLCALWLSHTPAWQCI